MGNDASVLDVAAGGTLDVAGGILAAAGGTLDDAALDVNKSCCANNSLTAACFATKASMIGVIAAAFRPSGGPGGFMTDTGGNPAGVGGGFGKAAAAMTGAGLAGGGLTGRACTT